MFREFLTNLQKDHNIDGTSGHTNLLGDLYTYRLCSQRPLCHVVKYARPKF